jgi:hypothetical protein
MDDVIKASTKQTAERRCCIAHCVNGLITYGGRLVDVIVEA